MTSENGTQMYMPVAPAGNAGGFGFGGDGGAWWLLILLIALGGGWGGGFGGFGGGNAIPWMNTNNDVQRGFDQNALMTGLNGIQNNVVSGFGNMQTALCNGFAGVANGFAQAEIANNARQIADMNQNFGFQTAMMQGLNGIQSQQSSCCCENRAGLADLKYTVATEACADRSAIASALKDVITANTASTQRILDQMCQDRIDEKNERISELERQLTMANLAASQTAQTAMIEQFIVQNRTPTTAA